MPLTVEGICEHCASGFLTLKSNRDRGWGRFCSKSCAAKARGGRPRLEPDERVRRSKESARKSYLARDRNIYAAKRKAWLQANPEKRRAQVARYRAKYPEKIALQRKLANVVRFERYQNDPAYREAELNRQVLDSLAKRIGLPKHELPKGLVEAELAVVKVKRFIRASYTKP